MIIGCIVVGSGLGLLSIGLKKGGFLTTSNVGDLQELSSIQEKLMSLDACAIRYGTRNKRGMRTHLDSAFVTPCSEPDRTVIIDVSSAWGARGVGFEMKRGSQGERWKVMVEKDEVPFPDLKGALEELSSTMATSYANRLAEQRARAKAYEEGVQARKKEADARKNGANSSYPSQ